MAGGMRRAAQARTIVHRPSRLRPAVIDFKIAADGIIRAPSPSCMLYPLVRPLLFSLDPETAHDLTLAGLDAAASLGVARIAAPRPPPSPVEAMGLVFPNRVGLAAGLDKNADHIDALAALGF